MLHDGAMLMPDVENKPLCIDLFCGLGGWAEGFLAEGWDVIGFDIERHDYGTGGYPGQLVLQDVTTLHGSQFRNADVIVASPPCQAYSYRAMPFKRAKSLPPPSNKLFDSSFRIQREACEAAGRYIPLVVENVRGAQPWVGRAAWHYGSYYLWGDVPALMPKTLAATKVPGISFSGYGAADYKGVAFNGTAEKRMRERNGWFTKDENGRIRIDHARNLAGQQGFAGRFTDTPMAWLSGRSLARKAASAQIAKIPVDLSRWIAQVYKPVKAGR